MAFLLLVLLVFFLTESSSRSYRDGRSVSYRDPVTGDVKTELVVNPGEFLLEFDINSDDTFLVSHLESPLFSQQLGDLLKAVNAYHAGVSFMNLRTRQNFTTDFVAVPSVLQSMFPKVVEDPSGHPTVVWIDSALTRFYPHTNASYWTLIEPVYTVTTDQFSTFVKEYIPKYNESIPWYKLFKTVKLTFPNATSGEVVLKGFNCFDYMEFALRTLKDLGAVTIPSAPVKFRVDKTSLFVDRDPLMLDFEQNRKEIVSFYQHLEAVFNKTISEEPTFQKILQQTIAVLKKGYIYHWEMKYWRLSVVSPYAQFVYDYWDLPK